MGWQGQLTHRQFLMWQIWMNDELNNPTRDNYYQMQIACEMRRTFVKNPEKIKTEQFKLKFENKEESKTVDPNSEEFKKQVQFAKECMIGFMSGNITVIQDGKEIEPITPPAVKRNEIIKQQMEKRKNNLKERLQEKQIEIQSNNSTTDSKVDKSNERRTTSRTNRKGR